MKMEVIEPVVKCNNCLLNNDYNKNQYITVLFSEYKPLACGRRCHSKQYNDDYDEIKQCLVFHWPKLTARR